MCEQTHRYNTRFQSSGKIKQQLCRSSTGQRFFLVRAINLWNYSIENNTQKENLSIFKKTIYDNFAEQISRFLILNIVELIEYFNILYSMFINWNNFCKNSNHND